MMKRNLLLVCLMSGAALAIAQDNYPSQSGTSSQPGMDQGTSQQQQAQPQQQGSQDRTGADTGYGRTSRETSRNAKRAKGVLMQGGRVFFVLPNGQTQPIDRETKIGDLKVNPDGTVTMKDGNTMTLKEGDSVTKDGIMGVEMRDGKLQVMSVGGQTREMSRREITLLDGSRVMRDGRVTMRDGTTHQLSNGDMIGADGMMRKGAGQQRQQEQQGGTMNQAPERTPDQGTNR